MSTTSRKPAPELCLPDRPLPADVERVQEFLQSQGTFQFPTVASGLFSAAAGDDPAFRLTGYQNVWARDNCHIAHALWSAGQRTAAVRATAALLEFYHRSQWRFERILSGDLDPGDPQNRPHVRFDGDTLSELSVGWSHAQNDALGYVVWLAAKLLRSGDLPLRPEYPRLLDLFVQYLQRIEYWHDADSGHWEETRKIEASSIGTVLAGLTQLREWAAETSQTGIDLARMDLLIQQGQTALAEILPAECIQPDPAVRREWDSALLFLAYPLEIIDDAMIDRIVENVRAHLTGPIGIRRYVGDSYWCADYRELLSPETRTTDVSDDMSARDALLKPGQEAQWCIFDPILSVIHGRRYLKTGDPQQFSLQQHHLQRALAQLTDADSRFGPWRCPESYFLERGQWISNDITPLLWTQANLLLALQVMRASAEKQ